jgi:hypothetical protein
MMAIGNGLQAAIFLVRCAKPVIGFLFMMLSLMSLK